jgi:hypothetical protein
MKDEQVKKSIFSRKYRQSLYLLLSDKKTKREEREITVMAVLTDVEFGELEIMSTTAYKAWSYLLILQN